MGDSIRVLVADDHWIVREGLRLILESNPGFELVGEAANGAEAVRMAGELQPEVVLMDLRMPGMDGLTAIQRLHVEQPHIAVVILTTYNEDELMVRGLRAGARGFLLKDTDRETLFNAIRAAQRGETLLTPGMMESLLSKAEPAPSPLELTERERQVLAGAARGERSKEIALRLGITERTVKAHLANIYHKLGVDSRAGAVSEGMRRGLLKNEE